MMDSVHQTPAALPKPPWLKARIGHGAAFNRVSRMVHENRLHTVCEEALCPNKGRCWGNGRATLMILGGVCSRVCGFCNVAPGKPAPADADEPRRAAEAVRSMGLDEVVITSVTRDDLPDGGAAIWTETIRRIRGAVPGILVEVLVPDFGGSHEALDRVLAERPDVLGHNIETVPDLYPLARPQADYARSLCLLRRAHEAGLIAKTSLMLGLGETEEQILAVMRDAREAGCEIFFLGQYLQPTRRHLPVRRFVPPEEFARFKAAGRQMGFAVVVSEPLVRSSFHSDEQTEFVRAAIRGEGRRARS